MGCVVDLVYCAEARKEDEDNRVMAMMRKIDLGIQGLFAHRRLDGPADACEDMI